MENQIKHKFGVGLDLAEEETPGHEHFVVNHKLNAINRMRTMILKKMPTKGSS